MKLISIHALAILIISLPENAVAIDGGSGTCSEFSPDAEWCTLLGGSLCNAAGNLGVSYTSACPTTCRSCEPGDPALAAELKSNLTVDFRTGFVLPDPSPGSVAESLLRGWNTWIRYTNASTVGFPAGNKFYRVNHTSMIMISPTANCEAYVDAARTLIDQHEIQAAVIANNFCKTELSQTYHQGGVFHLLQSGTPMVLPDGSQYLNKHSWFLHVDSNEYPQLFLKGLALKGYRKVALLSRASHPWTKASAKFVADNYISMYNMELAYNNSWEDGGGSLSASNDQYEELYNTTQWDTMLQEAADSGANVLVVYCIGEGASILKRMKALGINFEGVYMSVSPTRAEWSKFLGTDGDYVVAPAQWNEQAESLCDVFGSTANYAAAYSEYNGQNVDYHAATMTAAGITLQLAIQTRNSTDTATLLSVIQSMSRNTMFGRIRFSFRQRNFGRPPIGLQHQDAEMRVVYPEIMARHEVRRFVAWDCRKFLSNGDDSVCSKDQLPALGACSKTYQEIFPANLCPSGIITDEGDAPSEGVPVAGVIGGAIGIVLVLCVVAAAAMAVMKRKNASDKAGMEKAMQNYSQHGSFGAEESMKSRNLTYSGRGLASLNTKVSKPNLEVEVQDILGKGSGGIVYKGLWQGVPVALKVCRVQAKDETLTADPQDLFTMETGIGEALRHPNIVQLFGSEVVPVMKQQADAETEQLDEEGGSSVMPSFFDGVTDEPGKQATKDQALEKAERGPEVVMWEARIIQEFCMHGDLRKALKKARLTGQKTLESGTVTAPTIEVSLALALDVAAGMSYIHSMKIVHGDLKASNILLNNRESGQNSACPWIAKVSDFGLALVMDNDTSHVSGVFTGTITHMAPECLQDGRQSYAADVYAFGIVLFELMSAQGAYANKSSVWIIDAVVNKRQRPQLPPDTPVDILELFVECTQHEPAKRPNMELVTERLYELMAKHCPDESAGTVKSRIVSSPSQVKFQQPSSTSERLALGGPKNGKSGDNSFSEQSKSDMQVALEMPHAARESDCENDQTFIIQMPTSI